MEDVSEDLVFTLVPQTWSKPIGREIRKDATRQLHTMLTRAFMSTTGKRAKCEEDELFSKLDLKVETLEAR